METPGIKEIIFFYKLLLISTLSLCDQRTLYDAQISGNRPFANWTVHPPPPDQGNYVGWADNTLSEPNKDKQHTVFTVCSISVADAKNWIRTPFIERGEASEIYVEVDFAMRDCDLERTTQDDVVSCKEIFHLYMFESDNPDNRWSNIMDINRRVDSIFTEKKWSKFGAESFKFDKHVTTFSKRIPVTKRGFYIAFLDEGSCTMLVNLKISYKVCPKVTSNLANFDATATPNAETAVLRVRGYCVDNAVFMPLNSHVSRVCKHTGDWQNIMDFSSGCVCKQGYQPYSDRTKCIECKSGFYKSDNGNGACQPCPKHSKAILPGAASCKCNMGYKRASNEAVTLPCASPPSLVSNITVVKSTAATVKLAWKSLTGAQTGGRPVKYLLVCESCSSAIQFDNNPTALNSVTLRGLSSSQRYRITIYAINTVFNSRPDKGTPLEVQTKSPVKATVDGLRATEIGSDTMVLVWADHVNAVQYEVFAVQTRNRSNVKRYTSTSTNYTLGNLVYNTNYDLKVRAELTNGWTDFSAPLSVKTGRQPVIHQADLSPVTRQPVGFENPTIIGLIAGGFLFFVCFVCLAIYIYRKRHLARCQKSPPSVWTSVPYCNMGPTMFGHSHAGLPVRKTYVDPHLYEDPNDAVKEFAREINSSCITIEAVIGGGEFGDVCKGTFRLPNRPPMCVAIKTLKEGSSQKCKLDFLTEASIMGQFKHPNIINLEGVVTKSDPVMIVTEFMCHGSLDCFLKQHDAKLTHLQLVGMIRGISSGMQYLSEAGYVHRDLAARNILVDESYVCKVSDFGLSRELEDDASAGQAYTTKGGKIPVRWTAPEAIHYRKFTSASDVWSMGVVCWEVISYGERPYWEWSNAEVIQAVDKGIRLPPPMDCPEALYRLMTECWRVERSDRPTFADLVRRLDKLIRSPDLLLPMAPPGPNLVNLPTIGVYPTVNQWLYTHGFEQYTDMFVRAGICDIANISSLTLEDLERIGVSPVHIGSMIHAINDLCAHLYGPQRFSPHMVPNIYPAPPQRTLCPTALSNPVTSFQQLNGINGHFNSHAGTLPRVNAVPLHQLNQTSHCAPV